MQLKQDIVCTIRVLFPSNLPLYRNINRRRLLEAIGVRHEVNSTQMMSKYRHRDQATQEQEKGHGHSNLLPPDDYVFLQDHVYSDTRKIRHLTPCPDHI